MACSMRRVGCNDYSDIDRRLSADTGGGAPASTRNDVAGGGAMQERPAGRNGDRGSSTTCSNWISLQVR